MHLLFIYFASSHYTVMQTFLKYFIASGETILTEFFWKFENNEPNKENVNNFPCINTLKNVT